MKCPLSTKNTGTPSQPNGSTPVWNATTASTASPRSPSSARECPARRVGRATDDDNPQEIVMPADRSPGARCYEVFTQIRIVLLSVLVE
ncbi:hypothetical protein GCM10023214_13270 [Amycolatopsis dongchuanensis]|uniref:Uncharacterized protein n=1 Tax=Amycolatopsis dongchuanensis TaxID=1070866 RepID=A0ABP9Q3A6_9PSEU